MRPELTLRLLAACHRYLGIALGLFMLMWCLSGMVMMYVGYPALAERTRLAGLAPISWVHCCEAGATTLGDDSTVASFAVEMLADRPVLRLDYPVGPPALIDLANGVPLTAITPDDAQAVAADFARHLGSHRPPSFLGKVDTDIWTVSQEYNADRPLYLFALGDSARTELYVSSVTGKAVQITTSSQRFWSWLGAIPHWLYVTGLRARPRLWTAVVVWTAALGSLLTVLGLALGAVRAAQARPAGRWSPFRGVLAWHHLSGLLFGLFAFTFVASGLVSMNPWGLFAGVGTGAERARVEGAPPVGLLIRASLETLPHAGLPADVVSVTPAMLDGQMYLLATRASGARLRLDPAGGPAPLSGRDAAQIAALLAGGAPAPVPVALAHGDDYYFSRPGAPASFPVYRLVLNDAAHTRYYVDAVSGRLLAKFDAGARAYRWLFAALHRFDFGLLRARPLWDVVMLVLLAGVGSITATGCYLGLRALTGRRVRRAPPPP